MKPILLAFASLTAVAALTAAAQAKTIAVTPGGDAQEKLQAALIDAKPGDTVAIAAGRYDLTDGLSLDVAGVTVKGAGPDKTVLSFTNQKGAGEGVLISADRVTFRNLAIENPKGDGIKAKGVDQISYIDMRVEWTGGPSEHNGGYGVYPVSSTNVLVDRVTVKGASDAGIYIGQSRNVVVRNSRAEGNVAGIEIENCYGADVHDNVATHNAGGILVFDMPGLPQKGGHSSRVYHNQVVNNDTPNFAPKGNTVAGVPTGTGIMVMANRDVHVFDNVIDGNGSAAVMLVAFNKSYDDAGYDPLPRDVVVRNNKIGRNGFAPAFEGGAELAKAMGGSLPPVLWDGVASYVRDGQPVTETPRLVLLDGPVANLNLPKAGATTEAKPAVTPTLGSGTLPEPAPIVLPAAQDGLSR